MIYQPSAGVNILFIFHSQLVKNVHFWMAADLSYNPETSDFMSLASLFFQLFLQKVFLINYYIDFFQEMCFHPTSLSPMTCYL